MAISFPAIPLKVPRRATTYAVLKTMVNMGLRDDVRGQLPGQDDASDQIVINFPCMPDTIDLSRRANYKNLLHTPVVPDGLHFYDYTEPLSIPLSFSLHGYDEDYCGSYGPLMLLSIAAKLHALTLPIRPDDERPEAPTLVLTQVMPNGSTDQALLDKLHAKETADFEEKTTYFRNGVEQKISSYARFAFPPACSLNIMMAQLGDVPGSTNASNDGMHSLGINCIGFLTDVRVVFKGPWLQGSFSGDGLRNLPTEAEYSFTFIHQPGYTNNILGSSTFPITTTANTIYKRLYNTADLSNRVTYAGIDGGGLPHTDINV